MGTSSSRNNESNQEQPSYYQMAKEGYKEVVKAIIRPPRADYDVSHLGPPVFSFGGKTFRRSDFTLTNSRGLNLQCSHWEPNERSSEQLPCVIYMHGNSSARLEAISVLSCCTSVGTSVFAFDFAGSGISDGEYVSLGFYERDDLKCVIDHLRQSGTVSTIALWGRSMGAATALMHGHRDPSIGAMILDSPFSDLTRLAEEMADKGREQGIHVPGLFVSVGIHLIRGSVQRQAGFDIRQIRPIEHVDSCFIPALFIAANGDNFIHPRHSEEIYSNYAGDKNLIMVEGDHNSPRSSFAFCSAFLFLRSYLQIPESWELDLGNVQVDATPPWIMNRMTGMDQSLFINSDLGMTQQQQQQVQESLFLMFGHQTRNGQNSTTTIDDNQTSLMSQNQLPIEMSEWSCSMCTFINQPMVLLCSVCGFNRYQKESETNDPTENQEVTEQDDTIARNNESNNDIIDEN